MSPSSPPPPTIAHPLRILYLSPPESPKPALLQGDTLPVHTPYYTTTLPLWHDALPTPASLPTWRTEWQSPAAAPVVTAIGAWIVGAPKPTTPTSLTALTSLLKTIKEVINHHTSSDSYSTTGDGALLLIVGLKQEIVPRLEVSAEQWDDLGRECGGWEWVDGEVDGGGGERNEFGERVGVARLREALEAGEWDGDGEDGGDEDDSVDGVGDLGLGDEELGKEPILGGRVEGNGGGHGKGDEEGEDLQVEELESMMLKMQAIKDMGADMPEGERKKFAKRAVRDVMRTL